MAPATIALLLCGWAYLPGSPAVWTVLALSSLTVSALLWGLEIVAGPRPWQPWRVLVRDLLEDTKTAVARVSLQLTFVAYQAVQMIHAIIITIVRIAVTHRKMLEWQTAASAARQHGSAARSNVRLFVDEMAGSPLFALISLFLVTVRRPQALASAWPILLLWTTAPVLAYYFSQPVRRRRSELKPVDRRSLRLTARKTWRYFDAFVTSADRGLPPDNFQDYPVPVVAHRTSPTNIGMSLLAVLAAHDLRFIETSELAERIESALTTLEGMERFEGHLFNWYDSQTLTPLAPRYISSVDSGNLAAALLALAAGLRETAEHPRPDPTPASDVDDVGILLQQAIDRLDVEKPGQWADADARRLQQAAGAIQAALSGRGTEEHKLEALADPLLTLESIAGELETPTPGSPEGEIVYWIGCLRRTLAQSGNADPAASGHLDQLARRANALADGMNFRLLYDSQRGLLSVGYRPADAEGPGRHDTAYYDLLASEAHPSFVAIAKGDVLNRIGSGWAGWSPYSRRADASCRGAPRCSSIV